MPHQCTSCGRAFDDGSKEMLGGCPECGGTTFQFYPKGTEVPDEPPPDAEPPDDDTGVAETVGRAASTVRDFVSRDPGPAGGPPPSADSVAADSGTSTADSGASTAESGTPAAGSGGPNPEAPWPDASDAPETLGGTPVEHGSGDDTDSRSDPEEDDGIIVADETGEEDPSQASARTDLPDGEEDLPERDDTAGEPAPGDRDALAEGAVGADVADGSGATAPDALPSDGRVVSEPDDDSPDLTELREQLNDQFESIKIVEPGQYELNLMGLYDREEYIIALQENGRYVIQVPENWMGDRPGE